MTQYISDEIFNAAVAEIDSSDWKLEKESPVKFYTKPKFNCLKDEKVSVYAIKAFGTVSHPVELVFRTILNTDLRVQWSKTTAEAKHIVNFNGDPLKGGEDVIYSQGKGQLMVSPRDFCVARRWKPTNDGGFDMVMRSIVHKDCPEREGIVRGRMVLQALQLRPSGKDKTLIQFASQVDIAGWVPTTIVNMVSRKIPEEFIIGLETGCKIVAEKLKL